MTDFQILRESGGVDPRRISMRLGDAFLSRLVRHGKDVPDDWPEAPPVALAFRFIDNWRRYTLGSQRPTGSQNAKWRPAHHLSPVGVGYNCPNVSIWGEGSRVGVAAHADANNLKPSLRIA